MNPLTITFPSDREMLISRQFHAPREVVFEAFSSCRHLKNWWGPRFAPMVECQVDFVPGGHYRFVHETTDGSQFAFRGTYGEIVRPEKIEQTFEFEPMAGHISRETMTFSEVDGVTTITGHTTYDSPEDMKGNVDNGMEQGMTETFDRLQELLAAHQSQGGW